jgi:hypothetical protein
MYAHARTLVPHVPHLRRSRNVCMFRVPYEDRASLADSISLASGAGADSCVLVAAVGQRAGRAPETLARW